MGKRKSEWITKKRKRMIKQRDHGFADFLMVMNHFFDDLKDMIEELKDPRNQSYVTYDQKVLVMMGILKNVLGAHSMRQMDECINEENCIETLRVASGVSRLGEIPHRDTLNYYLEHLEPTELSGLRDAMIRKLRKNTRGCRFACRGTRCTAPSQLWDCVGNTAGNTCSRRRKQGRE